MQEGDRVFSRVNKSVGTILGTIPIRKSGQWYEVLFPSSRRIVPETDLLLVPDPKKMVNQRCLGPRIEFVLKANALFLRSMYAKGQMASLVGSRVVLMPHQVFAAHRACDGVVSRLLLADEVGLGKTIEAGLVLKELKARGSVRRTLIVTPASLTKQWIGELHSKFNEDLTEFSASRVNLLREENPDTNVWTLHDQVVVSLQLARRDNYQKDIISAGWDLVIFDEAHHLRRYLEGSDIRSTQSYDLASGIAKTTGSLLLLTATPVQLRSFELFSLIELLDVALFGDYRKFELHRTRMIRPVNRAIELLDSEKGDCETLKGFTEAIEEVGKWLRDEVKADSESIRAAVANIRLTSSLLQLLAGQATFGNQSDIRSAFLSALASIPKVLMELRIQGKCSDSPFDTGLLLAVAVKKVVEFNFLQVVQGSQAFGEADSTSLIDAVLDCLTRCLDVQFSAVPSDSITPIERSTLIERISATHLLAGVMVRNRKRRVLDVPYARIAELIQVQFTAPEQRVYDAVTEYVRSHYAAAEANKDQTGRFMAVMFQRLLTSSFSALAKALRSRRDRLLAKSRPTLQEIDYDEAPESVDEMAGYLGSPEYQEVDRIDELCRLLDSQRGTETKAARLVVLLNDLEAETPGQKVLIFTQFIETQRFLQGVLPAGYQSVLFNGLMKSEEKDEAVRCFRETATVMISTEAGGEGRNLQFCNVIVNYDLPWNPMKIEQRIGRLDRIGQKRDVRIFNLATEGTVEARILHVLQDRIKIFEESVGGLDPILGDEAEQEITKLVMLQSGRIDTWANDLEVRVAQARRAEEELRDFVMDQSSFDRGQYDRVLGRVQTTEVFKWTESLVVGFLSRFPTARLQQTTPGVWDVTLPEAFIEDARSLFGIDLGSRHHFVGVFQQRIAVEREDLEFLSFGHPVFDAVVQYCSRPYFERAQGGLSLLVPFGLSAQISVGAFPGSPEEGWLFLFEVMADGGYRTYREMVPKRMSPPIQAMILRTLRPVSNLPRIASPR
jgi:superfamily II DNA or RNA helicase